MTTMTTRCKHFISGLFAAIVLVLSSMAAASAQTIVYGAVPVIPVTPAPAYIANYRPTGNYAAVTAFSPPVAAALPTSSVAVTSYYSPAVQATVPVTSYYAPTTVATPLATTTLYAPASAIVAAPVTTYYAPATVAVPVYRRGPFGVYRPVRAAVYLPY